MFSDEKMKEFKKIDERIGVAIYAGKAVGVVAAYGEIDVLRARVDFLEKELEKALKTNIVGPPLVVNGWPTKEMVTLHSKDDVMK